MCATDSVTARRISATARMALDSRDTLTISAIWRNPFASDPTGRAYAASSVTSPLAIERLPSLSFSRSIR